MASKLLHDDCVVAMAAMPENSIDAIVTDPPYGLEFMGKAWDKLGGDAGMVQPGIGARDIDWPTYGGDPHGGANPTCATCGGRKRGKKTCGCKVPDWRVKGKKVKPYNSGAAQQAWHARWAREALRVLKPGGHLVAFGGTRTHHRLTSALEDEGFEIRDSLHWMYGSGFPKSMNVSKAIDKAAGVDPATHKAVQDYLRDTRVALGMSKSDVDKAVFGGTTRYSWVEGRGGKRSSEVYLPTPEEWVNLKEVLGLDDRYDAYISAAIPNRTDRYRADGGKAVLTGTEDGDWGYQKNGERWGGQRRITTARTPEAATWEGWGTALKPAHEPIVLARKPLVGTVAANVLAHGTGALNIDGCRVVHQDAADLATSLSKNPGRGAETVTSGVYGANRPQQQVNRDGRWPPNILLTHSAACADGCAPDCPVAALDAQSGVSRSSGGRIGNKDGGGIYGGGRGLAGKHTAGDPGFGDKGGASRFYPQLNWSPEYDAPFLYNAKAAKKEREAGCEHLGAQQQDTTRQEGNPGGDNPRNRGVHKRKNHHPTVKPVALMRWLVRLVTPPGGMVLDPFAGSGTTGIAAALEGHPFTLIEREAAYLPIITARIVHAAGCEEDA
jgi:DNA modification methylase